MKSILFSDIHLGLNKDNEKFHKSTIEFGEWMASVAKDRGITTLICGGDVFHNRKTTSLTTTNAAYNFFETIKDFDVKIITGNHDCYYEDNSKIHSMSLLKYWDNVLVYDLPYYEIIDGKRVGFIPWGTTVEEMEECDIMFGHFSITGFQMNGHKFCDRGMSPQELLKKCPYIFSGHFHKAQINSYKAGKIVYMGAPYEHDWGDSGDKKFIYELDFSSGILESIENNISPKHLEISTEKDLDKVDGNIIRVLTDNKNSDILLKVLDKSAISVDLILDDPIIKQSSEKIKDFKSVNILEGFRSVIDTLEGVDSDMLIKLYDRAEEVYKRNA